MPLKLMYITNRTAVAGIAEEAGVDRIFVDMEYIGKEARQKKMNTVKSAHTASDVKNIAGVLKKSELLVRVNPMHSDSETEIKEVIDCGADRIMLPMYKSMAEVEQFLKFTDSKVKTTLLAETVEATKIIEQTANMSEVDEIHIGLNDLHLALGKKFMFELLADGTVENLAKKIKSAGKPFGFGGIARIGYGMIPAEYIIKEHYRLGSSAAILSRCFGDVYKMDDLSEVEALFNREIKRLRRAESEAECMTAEQAENNRLEVIKRVKEVVGEMA